MACAGISISQTTMGNQHVGQIGTVAILERIGHGAMSSVYKGYQSTLKRHVAVKVLTKTEKASDITGELFRQEGEIVAGLSHPNIIPVFEMGETESFYFLVMQFVEGISLEQLIQEHIAGNKADCPFSTLEARLNLFCQVLDALDYAHNEHIVHQDIKPSNVLIERSNCRPLVADFGIASTVLSEIPNDKIYGSPIYISPERLLGEAADRRSDVYSAAMVLFKFLAGLVPLSTRDRCALLKLKVTNHDALFYCSPSNSSPLIDIHLEEILLHALEPDPDKRYASCGDFMAALNAYRRERFFSSNHEQAVFAY